MNRGLHKNDAMVNSAQYGWEQMKLLLDKNLPVSNKKSSRRFYVTFGVAASLTAILLMSSLVLRNGHHQHHFNNRLLHSITNQPLSKSVDQQTRTLINVAHSRGPVKINKPDILVLPKPSEKGQVPAEYEVQTGNEDRVLAKIISDQIYELDLKQPFEKSHIKNIRESTSGDLREISSVDAGSEHIAPKATSKVRKNNWSLFAGIGVNGMIGQAQNVQPFPVAEASYAISAKFHLSVGLALGSPVSTNSYGITKRVYLNDTANNIQLYNKVVKYNQLSYADIPLTAGLNITKRLSIQGGVQASVLLHSKNATSLEGYDFQMRLINGAQNTLVTGIAAPIEQDYTLHARKIDYRFTAGVKYTINRTSLNVMYQYSMQPLITGDYVVSKKNQLVTLKILYRR